jgi:AcrR family transcriptional regulator
MFLPMSKARPQRDGDRAQREQQTLSGLSPRDRLVRAALLELADQPLHKALGGLTTAQVARRAGVTTGSFFHHFANATEFADAIALSYAQVPSDVGEAIEEINEALQDIDLLDIMRGSLTDSWQIFHSDDVIGTSFRVQMHLWAHHDQPLSTPVDGFETLGDIFRHNYRLRQQEAADVWAQLLERSGRKIVPPFTLERLAVVLNSLFEGLVIRAAVDDESVTDEMFAEAATALGAALTVPRGSQIRLSDLTQPLRDESRLSPQARSGARRRRETRARITDASVDLFGDGWESVSASDVAEAAGVSPQTVINAFRSVRSVAASIFARNVPAIRRAALGKDPASEPLSALDRLEATLLQLARSVAADPEPARALLGERVEANLHQGGDFSEHDIRLEVPLADSVLRPLTELDLGDAEPIDVARTLIDFVLVHSLGRPDRGAETAQLALRLLPEGALVGSGGVRRVA